MALFPDSAVVYREELIRVPKAAYLAARDVIQNHLLDDEGMLDVPIDVFGLASRLDIDVSIADLAEGTGGLIVRENKSQRPRIFLNRSDSSARQKFTLAHEIGHYIRHELDDDFEYGYVDERADLASRGVSEEEIWSNKFAAELLMPAFAVRKFYGDGWSVSRLAREFGVSEQAMSYRLQNLGLA